VLLLLFLAFEMIRNSTGRIRFPLLALGFALIGSFTLTVKETPAASFFLIALGVVAVLLLRRDFRSTMIFVLACCLTSLVALVWLAHLVGGFDALAQMSTATAAFLQTSPYSIEYEAGPPWQLLHGLFLISAAGSLLFAVSLPYAFTPKRPVAPQRQMLLGLAIFTIFFLLLAALLPHHLNLRYICAVYGPIYLLAGVGLTRVFTWLRAAGIPENALMPVLGIAVLLAASLDYRGFLNNFAAPDVQDLSIRMVLAAEESPLPPSAATPVPAGLPTLDANKEMANNWINTSNSLQQAGLCQQALDAARKAVGFDPGNPIAWNNIAAGNECLHQWQPAIEAATQALKLQPDFQLARNNLMWSLEQQRKDAGK
jgi:tetratricopeptide (TPR) repeat protein